MNTDRDEKLSVVFNIRITPSLKDEVDRLPEEIKQKLLRKLRKEMLLAVHISKFNPNEMDLG